MAHKSGAATREAAMAAFAKSWRRDRLFIAGHSRLHPVRQRTRVRRQRDTGRIAVVGLKTAYIERGSPWENGYIESFNARELLEGEIFYTLREAQIVIESWRRHYNTAWGPLENAFRNSRKLRDGDERLISGLPREPGWRRLLKHEDDLHSICSERAIVFAAPGRRQ